jgi:hypothetical protein
MTKPDYDRAFKEARRWVLEEEHLNKDSDIENQGPLVAARIWHVKEEALQKLIYRV